MLSEIRNQEFLFDVPKFNIEKGDVENLIHELKGFHEVFTECFHRSESRDHFYIWLYARRKGGRIVTYYGIALIILGLIALAGIIYVQLDKKHLRDKRN